MDAIEQEIDALYAGPLGDFVASRQALAKKTGGEAGKRIKALSKPTTLPWTVNQLYWHQRPVYDALVAAGTALRRAQVAALEGRQSHVPKATAEHRRALSAAVAAASGLGREAKVGVDTDALARMLETISLAERLSEPHGRFTEPVQPAGFEALLGVDLQARAARSLVPFPVKPGELAEGTAKKRPTIAQREAQREREEQARITAEAERKREAAIAEAKAVVAEAKREEARARDAWRKAKDALIDAEHALEDLEGR